MSDRKRFFLSEFLFFLFFFCSFFCQINPLKIKFSSLKISMNVWTALVKTVARASIRTGDSAVRALLGGVEISATKVSEFWE